MVANNHFLIFRFFPLVKGSARSHPELRGARSHPDRRYRQSLILAALICRPFITSQAFFSVNMNALREQY